MYFSSLGGWLSSLISRHCKDLIVSPKRSLKAVVGIEMDPIYISDSDSDIEDITGIENSDSDIEDITGIENSDSDIEDITDIETSRGSGTSIDHRVLPSWMSMSGTNSRNKDDGGLSRKVRYPRTASSLNGSSVYACHHPQDKIQIGPFSGDNIRSSKHTAQSYDSKYSMENGNSGLLRSITSQNSDMSGIDYGKYSSEQALKKALPPSLRTLPSSFHPSKSSYSGDYVAASQIHNTGNSYQSVGSRLTNGKGYMTDHISSGSANGVFMNENSGHRNLPPSLMHVKSALPTQIASSSNPGHHSESAAGHDERLIYQAALEDLNQPKSEATLPKGLLSVSLLRHQKIALAWMLQKETRSLHCLGGILADDQGLGKTISMISLIQMQRSFQEDFKKEHLRTTKTEALNLEDDDGSAGLNKVEQTGDSDDIKMIPEVSTSIPAFSRRRQAVGTLVVCPASILRQWARELDEKVAKEAKFSVLIYHGGSRTKDPVELAKYDVVLTTYAIVTNEVPKQSLVKEDGDEKNGEKYGLSSELSFNNKRKKKFNDGKKRKKGRNGIDSLSIDYGSGPLARVGWFRVILDEAQTIKNHKTQVSRACCSLRAKRRWCLSGTPLQNTIDDLYSYFRFLRYDPYASYKSFYLAIKLPVSRDSVQGYKKLQAVLRAIMLRRTKGTLLDGEPIINLPPKSICLTKVDFPSEERAFYDKLEADSRSQFKAYAAAGTVNQNYANILLMLLRLRQACDHPLLVKGFNSDRVGKVSLEMAKCLPPDMMSNLLSLLETSSAICHVCSDPPEDAVVTMCGHVFCCQCVSEYLTGDDNTCPAPGCKEHLGSDVVFSKATLRSCSDDDFDSSLLDSSQSSEKLIVLKKEYISSKIRAAIEILQSHCKVKSSSLETEGSTKAIVFSQWTRMLDLVENSLKESSLQYRRLDGTMTLGLRDRAVRDFNTNPEVTVMLMSLKAGNLGLNMIAASHVIILDLWWNPTTEDQAIDRAHRIGQTRPVTVSRLTISNTVEDRILALQEQKRKMVASAFGEEHSGGSATRLTVDDLRYLFMV